jgi:hypothetical protein
MASAARVAARWRRLSILAVLAAFVAQMALPLAHASARVETISQAVAHAQGCAAHAQEIACAAATAPHDASTCPVCQSLLHPKPAAPTPVLAERRLPELAAIPYPPAQRAHACPARTGNPPRAPPLAALSLA